MTGDTTAAITYADLITHSERRHEYCCRKHVRVGAQAKVVEIRHEDLPGESERFSAFERGE